MEAGGCALNVCEAVCLHSLERGLFTRQYQNVMLKHVSSTHSLAFKKGESLLNRMPKQNGGWPGEEKSVTSTRSTNAGCLVVWRETGLQ